MKSISNLFLLSASLFLGAEKLSANDADPLEKKLIALARAHHGKVAIALKNLKTGDSFSYNADLVMPTASLIKLPVMIEVYQQAAEGKIKLSDMLTLRDKDKVPGSGILTYHFSEGATFSIRDATRLMIAYSDNTATNLILDRIGIAATAKRMEAWGFPNTKLHAKVFLGQTTSIPNLSHLEEITRALAVRNYSDRQIRGILGENFLRVCREVFGK